MAQERLTRYSSIRLEAMKEEIEYKQRRVVSVAVGADHATLESTLWGLSKKAEQDGKVFEGFREAISEDLPAAGCIHEAIQRWYALNERRGKIDSILTRRGLLGEGNV